MCFHTNEIKFKLTTKSRHEVGKSLFEYCLSGLKQHFLFSVDANRSHCRIFINTNDTYIIYMQFWHHFSVNDYDSVYIIYLAYVT